MAGDFISAEEPGKEKAFMDYRMKQKLKRIGVLVPAAALQLTAQTQAASAVVSKINSLNTLVVNIITACGVIVLAWGIFEFASAYQSHDTSQQTMSLKKVVSGILMVAAPTIIAMLK